MKEILAGAAFLGSAVSAQAADLPVKAPYYKAPAIEAVYDWTGFYTGVNAGVGLGRNRSQQDFGNHSTQSLYLQPLGGIGGAQVGYNWQANSFLGPVVFGLEADFQGADMTDDRTDLSGFLQFSQKLDWFGTVRGRVGLVNGPILTYVTGGYAIGSVKTSLFEIGDPFAFNSNRSGWTWGSGVEAAIGGNWTAKIEYLYLDLGSRTYIFDIRPYNFGGTNIWQRLETHENIFRVGLNYHFGGNSAYTPWATSDWSGFYLGGNFGGGTGRDQVTLMSIGYLGTFNLAPDGIMGGVQIGYNWQTGNFVYSVEADLQGSTMEDDKTCLNCTINQGIYNSKLQWFGTMRGRLGYSIGPSLLYATGGFAYGGTKNSVDEVSFSNIRTGWTVGAGIETPFTLLGLFGPNWTSKTEYLYVDLSKSTQHFRNVDGTPMVFSQNPTEHIFRTGLNYHFNSPVVAKY
jgi:outer membrane immunogenic protein